MAAILKMRAGQRRFLRLVDEYRLMAFLARRQYGKTTTFAKIALKKMMKNRNHTIIFGSAKIDLSREIVRAESFILQSAIQEAIAQVAAGRLRVMDSQRNVMPDALSADDFAELFETQRLEFRFYHTDSSYSRTKVVALRPDTVGETGDLMCDEIGRVRNWRETWEAVAPIISSNPQFRCTLSTTVPPDDTHYSFDQLLPPVGTEFVPNAEGNLYTSEMGIKVLRVDADDAFLDGVPLYNMTTGEPETPDQNRAGESDKDAWDRNYGLKFVAGGSAACGLTQLSAAQERGIGSCAYVEIRVPADIERAASLLLERLAQEDVGVGWDLATTEKQTSNPSALAVVERSGANFLARLVCTWKTADPETAEAYVRAILGAVARRATNRRPRALAIDSTNERYFASSMQTALRALCPVQLVVGSETIERPGYEPMSSKQYLGGMLTGILDDNRLTLPADRYIKEDFRLVKRERGSFVCTPDAQGRHGDTFDAVKLAIHALSSKGDFRYTGVETRAGSVINARRACGIIG